MDKQRPGADAFDSLSAILISAVAGWFVGPRVITKPPEGHVVLRAIAVAGRTSAMPVSTLVLSLSTQLCLMRPKRWSKWEMNVLPVLWVA